MTDEDSHLTDGDITHIHIERGRKKRERERERESQKDKFVKHLKLRCVISTPLVLFIFVYIILYTTYSYFE